MPDGTALPVTAVADALARVERGGGPVALTRDGSTVAVLVSVADAARLAALDEADATDAAAVREAMAEYERTGGRGWATLAELAARDGIDAAELARRPE